LTNKEQNQRLKEQVQLKKSYMQN